MIYALMIHFALLCGAFRSPTILMKFDDLQKCNALAVQMRWSIEDRNVVKVDCERIGPDGPI